MKSESSVLGDISPRSEVRGQSMPCLSSWATSRDNTPFSQSSVMSDVELECQMQQLVCSISEMVPDVGKGVCLCDCHMNHGYEADMSHVDISDACLECECYERW